jgi:hypothetical protein
MWPTVLKFLTPLIIVLGVFFYGKYDGKIAEKVKWQAQVIQEREKAQEKADAKALAYNERSRILEAQITSLQKSQKESQAKREKEYVSKPVYSDCVAPLSGVQLLNERIAQRPATPNTGERTQ